MSHNIGLQNDNYTGEKVAVGAVYKLTIVCLLPNIMQRSYYLSLCENGGIFERRIIA